MFQAALAVGGALMGALGGRRQSQSTTTNNTPWAPQAEQLQYGFGQARSLYDNAPVTYQGALSAGMTDTTRAGIDNAVSYATGAGADMANRVGNTSGVLMGAAPGFVDRAANIAQTGVGGMNATTQNVLTAAANGAPLARTPTIGRAGQMGMGAAFDTASGLVDRSGGDPAMRALATGGAFANSDVIQDQIDDAALDVRRNLNETVVPGLNARASAGGNLNSARAGVAEAIARRDAGESVGRIAANLRGQAFSAGIGAGMEGNAQNNALALGANAQRGSLATNAAGLGENARQFDAGTRLSAATGLGSQDLAARSADVEARLAGNAQTGQAVSQGLTAAPVSQAMANTNFGTQISAGQMLQDENQRALLAEYEQYMRDYNTRQGYLSDFMGTVGSQNWGSSGTSTTQGAAPNPFQGALGGAMTGAGVYRNLFGK